jgi:hypothetical protein
MANRGKTHNEEVYCIKDLAQLGSSKMKKAYRGMLVTYRNVGILHRVTSIVENA